MPLPLHCCNPPARFSLPFPIPVAGSRSIQTHYGVLKQRIENIINNFNERGIRLSNNKFKIYSLKEDKEANPRVTL